MNACPALFLDRDGVINLDHGYVVKPQDFEFVDGIFDLCRAAKKRGYWVFVVTNQAGIGRGYYSERDFLSLTDWMCVKFAAEGADIDKVYFCPTHPEFGLGRYKVVSPFRKPGPGMIRQAAREFDAYLSGSILVGDRESDIAAGIAAGVGCNVLYCRPPAAYPAATAASQVVDSLADVISLLR